MKQLKYTTLLAVAGAFAFASCSAIDDATIEGGTVLQDQFTHVTSLIPSRVDAIYSGMYTKLGDPLSFGRFSSSRPDDFGFIMMCLSGDLEGADISTPDSGYNWFSACMDFSSRDADYANPYIRYRGIYDEIARTHDVMRGYGEITPEMAADVKYRVAQAYAVRAYCYLSIAPFYQFGYATSMDKPCVPIVTLETTDFANNPRASVKDVYDLIISDLTTAIENLKGYERPDKAKIDSSAAYGLRARAYLQMGMYAEAAADADKAMKGYAPASIQDLSKLSFYDISEENWIWGYDLTPAIAQTYPMATSAGWIGSFSGIGYSTGAQTYFSINNLLYDKIPSSDVRKGWWVNEDLYSPLLEGLTWENLKGQEIATEEIEDVKLMYLPYTNVKFGTHTVGGTVNDDDFPFLRVEEMILTKAEGLIKSGKRAEGIKVLNDFVRTYRDPEYNAEATGRSIEDEIWFQRRVELWGEGFFTADLRRLNKPIVRFHNDKSNLPDNFRINIPADDPWLLMRFCTDELNTNFGIVDNTGGQLPTAKQNPELRDGVTD